VHEPTFIVYDCQPAKLVSFGARRLGYGVDDIVWRVVEVEA
jgi:hypothetical protein